MKLSPLPYKVHQSNDGYRGHMEIVWKWNPFSPQRSMDTFGTWCPRCFQGWGYHPDLQFVRKLYRAMAKWGCPKCRKDLASTRARLVPK